MHVDVMRLRVISSELVVFLHVRLYAYVYVFKLCICACMFVCIYVCIYVRVHDNSDLVTGMLDLQTTGQVFKSTCQGRCFIISASLVPPGELSYEAMVLIVRGGDRCISFECDGNWPAQTGKMYFMLLKSF